MKKIPNTFGWTDREFWWWSEHDEKLILFNDYVRDIDVALQHCEGFEYCIQAGSACGIWPAYLGTHFTKVMSFEVDEQNFKVARANNWSSPNIAIVPLALADFNGEVIVKLDDFEKNNAGAKYVERFESLEIAENHNTLMIDQLYDGFEALDLICLDIEGYECRALKGAVKTLEKFNPVVMIEEKPLPHMQSGAQLEARLFLESIGYKEVDSIHRDVVFKR